MKVVVKNDEYTVYQRRDGRYAVQGADKKAVNGDDKVAILAANDLIKVAVPAAPIEEPAEEVEAAAEEATSEESAEESTEGTAKEGGGPAAAGED